MPLLNDQLDFSAHPLLPPSFSGDMVIWMVVDMDFFRNEPITDVVRRLNLSTDSESVMNLLTRSAVTQARQRVGAWGPPQWNGSSVRPHRHGARNVT